MDQVATVDRVRRWAVDDDNIRAVVLTGSVARGDHDELSDVDVELYLREPSDLLNRRDWYQEFGDVLAVEELPNPEWIPTRLLYMVDGKIVFAIGDLASFGARSYSWPFRVVVDKDDRAEVLEAAKAPPGQLPAGEEFKECENWFSAAALMQAKLIARHEPWLAKYRDWDLKAQLLRMIVWDHKCRHGLG
jgi:aminoglycoside 6-adenylyltransferase